MTPHEAFNRQGKNVYVNLASYVLVENNKGQSMEAFATEEIVTLDSKNNHKN